MHTANSGPRWRRYLRAMGPGLVSGASDDDLSELPPTPRRAKHGLSFLWTALLTFPLMAAVQEICDRTALATGSGLGELTAQRFKRTGRSILFVLLVVLIIANALNIAADLVAVGSGMTLLKAGPTWLEALVAGGSHRVGGIWFFGRIVLVFKVLCSRFWCTSSLQSMSPISGVERWPVPSYRTFNSTRTTSRCWWRFSAPAARPTSFLWQSAHR